MSYSDALRFLFDELPMYQSTGAKAFRHGLANAETILSLLNHPEKKFPAIHIAGTNGKGSVAHLTASVLQEAGYSVGLFTSPHLLDFRERMRVNGALPEQTFVSDFVAQYRDQLSELDASFYEISFAMSLAFFAEMEVDIAVIETGLGGRLDPTVLCDSVLTVVTNIGLDHTAILGHSLAEIAAEKAGICKPSCPFVIGERKDETEPVFRAVANKNQAPIYFVEDYVRIEFSGNSFSFEKNSFGSCNEIDSELKGSYQKQNLATAYTALKLANAQAILTVSEEQIMNGFSKVIGNTSLLGRWQQLGVEPKVICDTGHNAEGIKYSAEQLQSETYANLHIVFGVVADKLLDAVFALLPKGATYYFCEANISRALPAQQLCDEAKPFSLSGKAYASVALAYSAARASAKSDDLIFVGGSTFVVAELLQIMR